MINVNQNSWHYRLIKFCSMHPSANLCPYMRQLIFSLFMCFCASILFTLLVILPLGDLIGWFAAGLVWGFVDPTSSYALMGILYMIVVSVLFVVDVILEKRKEQNHRLYEERIKAISEGTWEKPKPSIFKSYYHALHDKVCPTIRFTK